ncbi:MAG: D-alanyl-D-alanine carboxypeptidase/D-alanyl-D-alanine-endopeptidase [Flavisolibacter sp.]
MYDTMKRYGFALFLLIPFSVWSQNLSIRLNNAFNKFLSDTQLRSGIASIYVADPESGRILFERNSRIGLAPASTQKIVTSVAGYETLGKDFRFITDFYFKAENANDKKGNLYIRGNGDPTLGSWRWKETSEKEVLGKVVNAIRKNNINEIDTIIIDAIGWNDEPFPGGWTWQDIGNYYGAGAREINWRENQYDIVFRSGEQVGESVNIVEVKPSLHGFEFRNYVTSAGKGTGDLTNIYLPLNSSVITIRGTIPINEKNFAVSGSMPSGENEFIETIKDSLGRLGVKVNSVSKVELRNGATHDSSDMKLLVSHASPVYDSLEYWFLKKSINLYGEAILKTIAYLKNGVGATDEGVEFIKKFYQSHGIDTAELSIKDGSGLSPENRVTTHAQVIILLFAYKQPWFKGFYNAIPEYNGMKMKSGTIGRVKGYSGYYYSKSGKKYVFSFLVNNYEGPESSIVKKMYKVLDEMK